MSGGRARLWAATAIIAVVMAAVPERVSDAAHTLSFGAVADATVRGASPTSPDGGSRTLLVDAGSGSRAYAYLKFAISGVGSGRVASARLRAFVDTDASAGTVDGPAAYGSGTGWTEGGLTWNTKPASTPAGLGDKGAMSGATWAEWDVSSLVGGDGTYAFQIKQPDVNQTDGVSFHSRENANTPQLVLTVEGGGGTPATGGAIVMAAGDISCDPGSSSYNGGAGTSSSCRQKATSDLLVAGDPAVVLALGDLQYESGELATFRQAYDPTWGRLKSRTRPTVGNHEYHLSGASGYFDYFGAAAGPRDKGYYSYDAGGWRLIALNSNCAKIGGCGVGSPQYEWLKRDLAAHANRCSLAYTHHPRYSSGSVHGSYSTLDPLWDLFQRGGGELWLSGHEHNYERFAPINAAGRRDDAGGVRQIIAGTGGKNFYGFRSPLAHSQSRNADTFGVLRLVLGAGGYEWRFVPVAGKSFSDAGSTACH